MTKPNASPAFATDPQAWTTLASKYLFTKPWLTMRQDRVQLPTGGIVEEFFVWEYPAWVNVIAETTGQELVLIRQFRYAVQAVYYELPAGTVDKGESPLDAAQRELLEETGYGGGVWTEWMTLAANPAIQTNLTYTFLATGVEKKGSQQLESTEEIAVHLTKPGEVRRIIFEGEMIQALHAAPLLKYLMSKPTG